MDSRFSSPRELVEALHARAREARAAFGRLLREPISRLMEQFAARHGLEDDLALLTLHALHTAEAYVRARPVAGFDGMSWQAFRAGALLHVAKLAFQPYGRANGPGGPAGPAPLPDSPQYEGRAYFRPYERVGSHRFGGDWFAGQEAPDGALWVLLADITGHGYFAYLLACGLPDVWRRCWAKAPEGQPADLLTTMHELLSDCLPEGVFVECTLARLAPDGEAVVAPAGGTRLLVRREGEAKAELFQLRGLWLGLGPPSLSDQKACRLGPGDEVLLATDGVFDQLAEQGGVEGLRLEGPGGTLFDTVEERLRLALAQGPQMDDLTMVLLRRKGSPAGAPDVPV